MSENIPLGGGAVPPLRPPGVPEHFPDAKTAVIIHHWDADGISSAAMVKKHLQSRCDTVYSMPPTLGNFFMEERELDYIKSLDPDLVIVVDICMAKDRVLEMKERLETNLWIFDHHRIDPIVEICHVNPIAYGHDGKCWPSASFIISRWLRREDDVLTFLGVAGDWEERATNLQNIFPQMERALARHNLAFPDLQRFVSLLSLIHI